MEWGRFRSVTLVNHSCLRKATMESTPASGELTKALRPSSLPAYQEAWRYCCCNNAHLSGLASILGLAAILMQEKLLKDATAVWYHHLSRKLVGPMTTSEHPMFPNSLPVNLIPLIRLPMEHYNIVLHGLPLLKLNFTMPLRQQLHP